MTQTMESQAPDRSDDAVALMYPDNQLKAQVREFEETFSAFTLLATTFFQPKKAE